MSLLDFFRRATDGQAQLGLKEMPLDPRLADLMAQFFPMPVVVLDKDNDRISWASLPVFLLTGLEPAKLRSFSVRQFLQEYFSPAEPLLAAYAAPGESQLYQGTFRTPQGSRIIQGIWIVMPGGENLPACCMLVFQDVTEAEDLRQQTLQYAEELQQQMEAAEELARERQAALEKLQQQSERVRLLATAAAYSNTMKFILDKEGRIVWVNPLFERASGWTLAELSGKHVSEIGGSFAHLLRHPEDTPRPETLVTEHFGRAPFTEEIYAYDRRGGGGWFLLTLAPIKDELGYTTHYIGAMINITHRKEHEVKLEAYYKEISDSLRYAARIQQRFVVSAGVLKPYFRDAAIWHAPQIGIGGDFLQAQPVQDGTGIVLALGDCTGHGVPASLLSVYAATLIRGALDRYGENLEELYQSLLADVQDVFGGGEKPLSDGFEIALLSYHPTTRKAAYMGAGRPLWVLRAGEIYMLAGGKGDISATNSEGPRRGQASLQRLTLEPGDRIYLFSDGVTDQLNVQGKRFGTSRLKDFFKVNSYLPVSEQLLMLQQALRQWAADASQTDDILMLAAEIG